MFNSYSRKILVRVCTLRIGIEQLIDLPNLKPVFETKFWDGIELHAGVEGYWENSADVYRVNRLLLTCSSPFLFSGLSSSIRRHWCVMSGLRFVPELFATTARTYPPQQPERECLVPQDATSF